MQPQMQPKNTDRYTRTAQYRLLTGILLAATVTLSACSSSDNTSETRALPDYDPDPVSVNEAASEVDTGELRLPLQLEDDRIVDPGWQTPPHYAGRAYSSDDTGTVAVPTIISPTGSAVIEVGDQFYLSTPH